MGMCKGCSEVFSALEMKDGLCKECISKGVVIEEPKEIKKNGNLLATSLIAGGLIWGVWAFNLDTTVTTMPNFFNDGSYIPSVTVENISLMKKQQNYLIGAGVATIIGVILFAMGGRRKEEE